MAARRCGTVRGRCLRMAAGRGRRCPGRDPNMAACAVKWYQRSAAAQFKRQENCRCCACGEVEFRVALVAPDQVSNARHSRKYIQASVD